MGLEVFRSTSPSLAGHPTVQFLHSRSARDDRRVNTETQEMAPPPVRVMHLLRPYFDRLASGRKSIEVRVAYPDRRDIEPGQLIRFESDSEFILTRVTRVGRYGTFAEMLDQEDLAAISGIGETREELMAAITALYSEEKEQLGVLALAVELVQ